MIPAPEINALTGDSNVLSFLDQELDIPAAKNGKALSAWYSSRMDIIRFVAISSVVWGHCLLGLETVKFSGVDSQTAQSVLLQTGRVGTLLFFLVSGFLLSTRIESFTLKSYLKYRLFSLIVPWLIFVSILIVVQLFQTLSLHQVISGPVKPTLILLFNLFKASLFHAAYWFIPVVLLSASLLIVLKKQVKNLWFGGLLLAITLFYGINLYCGWVSANHTRAFLGYVFFMWLGIRIKDNIALIEAILHKIPVFVLWPLLFLTYALACGEGKILSNMGCVDPYASIRWSNAVFSVLLFLYFLKSDSMGWVKWLNPRQSAYGVYLVHSLVIIAVTPFINKAVIHQNTVLGLPALMLRLALFFVLIFGISCLIVTGLRKSPLYFIAGRQKC